MHTGLWSESFTKRDHLEDKDVYGTLEGEIQLVRLRRRWEDNIKMDVWEIGLEFRLDLSGSEQGPVAASCGHGNQPSGSVKSKEFIE
jgi:hypothetical protein